MPPVMANRRKPMHANRSEDNDTRDAILVAAGDLVARYGLRKTTMEDIAVAMGKRKSFLYYYFNSKEEVLAALAEKEFQDVVDKLRAAVENHEKPVDRLRIYFEARFDHVAQRFARYESVRGAANNPEETLEILKASDKRRQFNEGEVRYLAELIQEGIRAKIFRAMPDKEIQLFCSFIITSLQGNEFQLLFEPKLTKEIKARIDVGFDVLLRGLLR